MKDLTIIEDYMAVTETVITHVEIKSLSPIVLHREYDVDEDLRNSYPELFSIIG